MHFHPRPNEHGQPHPIATPHSPTPLDTWADPEAIATAVPDGPMPVAIGNLALSHAQLPEDVSGLEALAAACDFDEPAFAPNAHLKASAGAVVLEEDGRIWLMSPSNGFGGYANTFPKGRQDPGLSLRATAIKEVFEETGLLIRLTGFLLDQDRSITRCRYYLARRVTGNPADMGWEAQAVHLVPRARLAAMAAHVRDASIVAAVLAHTGA